VNPARSIGRPHPHRVVVFTRARLHDDDTTIKKKYETPSAVSLAERARPRARARTVKAIFDDEL